MSGRTCLVLRAALAVLAASAGVTAFANEKSAPLVEDAQRKIRRRDGAAALKALEAAVAADPGDADAQILYQDALRRGTPEKALLEQYRKAAAAKPDDPLLAYLAARLLDPDDAAHAFVALQQKFPDSPWPHEGRAVALDAGGKTKEAGPEHDAAVSLNPREPRFRVSQARGFERAGQWPQAVEIWKLAAGLRPSDRALILGLGEAMRRSGLLDDAVLQFETAAKLDPTDPEPRYRIGLARQDANRFDEALKSFDASIALDKGYVDPYCAAARAAVSAARANAARAKRSVAEADFAPAISYGTRGVQADAQSAAAHIALGNAEEATAEIASAHAANALREYDAALALVPATSPDRVAALVGRAYVLLLDERWDDSVAAADKAIDQDPRAITAYLTAGRALDGKGEPDDAVRKYYTPGLKVAPADAALRHARGVTYCAMGKLNEARKDLDAAVKAEPKNGRYLLSFGELCYQVRDYAAARPALTAAADAWPHDPRVWRALGRTLTSLKDYETAASAYEEVVKLVEGDGTAAAAPPAAPAPPDGPAPPPSPPAPTPPAPAPPAPTPPAPGPTPTPTPPAPTPPPPSGDAPPPATAPAPAEPKFATAEHLYLTLLYADKLNQKDKAKAHARKWVEQGGKNPNLDSWVQDLLTGK